MLAYAIAAVLLAASSQTPPQVTQNASQGCQLGDSDLIANRRLSFEAFDQVGELPSTARALGERDCYAEAARASEDYLLHGPETTSRQREILAFHMGQYLATAGQEREAARVIATARTQNDPPQPDGFDWNTYVVGTWAFLTRDRALLEASHARLAAAPGERNAYNARALAGLVRCFGRPYREAYGRPGCYR